jgi:hypothetical protein
VADPLRKVFASLGLHRKSIDAKQKSRLDGAHENKTPGLILAVSLVAGAACFAANPQMGTGRIVVSADGKSRTVTTGGSDAKGNSFKSTAVYDKQ